MRILKLELDFFKSHKSTVLDFSESNFWMIQGQNGAGKSSIFNAVIWALYGSTSNLKKSKILNKTSKRCRVILTLEKNDEVYEVARHVGNWKTFDQSSAPLMMRKGGTLVTDFHHGKSVKTDRKKEALLLQTEIERIVGLSEKAFSSIISFGQEAKPLSSQSSSDKRAIFEEMLNTDWINVAQENAKSDFDVQAQKMESIKNTLAHVAVRIEDKTKQLNRDTETLMDFEVRKKLHIQQIEQGITQTLKELKQIRTSLKSAQEKSPVIVSEIDRLEVRIKEFEQEERELRKSHNLKSEPLQKSIQAFKNKKIILQNADDLVRRHYENTQNTEKQLEGVQESITRDTAKIIQTARQINTLGSQIKTHDNTLETQNLNLVDTKKDVSCTHSELSRLNKLIAEKSVVIKSLTKELEKESTSWTCNRAGCGRTFEPDQEKLSEIQAKIDAETKGVKAYQIDLDVAQTRLSDLESTYKKRLEMLSKQEKSKSGAETTLKILSEDLESLKSGKMEKEKQEKVLAEKLNKLQAQNPESANQAELQELTMQIQQSTKKLEELQTNFNTARDALVLEVKSLATKLQESKTELGILKNTVKTSTQRKKETLSRIEKLETQLVQEKQTVCNITQEDIDQLKTDLVNLKKEQFDQRLELHFVVKRQEIASKWKNWLNHKGLRTKIFEAKFDRLNEQITHYAQLVGLDIVFKIENNGNRGFLIEIQKGNLTLKYDELSGGQKTLTDFCILFALHDLAGIPVLFLDEAERWVDENNKITLMEMVQEKAKICQIFYITHHQDLAFYNTKGYEFTLNEGFTEVVE